jgi:hypothetical protein
MAASGTERKKITQRRGGRRGAQRKTEAAVGEKRINRAEMGRSILRPYAECESGRTAKNGCATLVGGGGLLLVRDDFVDF